MGLMNKFLMMLQTEKPYYEDYEPCYSYNQHWSHFELDNSVWCEDAERQPDIHYVRQLQICYQQLLSEIDMLNRTIDLEKKLAIQEGQSQVLQEKLNSALKYQTSAGAKAELFSDMESPEPMQIAEEKPKVNNRFVSVDGVSKRDKMKSAIALYHAGVSLDRIADILNVKTITTVSGYISTMKKHVMLVEYSDHTGLVYDSEYDADEVDLRIYDEYKTNDNGTTSARGKIVAL